MSVDKIGSVLPPVVTTHPKAAEKKPHPESEAQGAVKDNPKPETNKMLKTNDPPFFPICDTQSIFKIEK